MPFIATALLHISALGAVGSLFHDILHPLIHRQFPHAGPYLAAWVEFPKLVAYGLWGIAGLWCIALLGEFTSWFVHL